MDVDVLKKITINDKTFSFSIKKPQQIIAKYRIVTPMFVGDANQKATTISEDTFKGALRRWWQMIAWHRIKHNQNKIKENQHRTQEELSIEALKQLHREELSLFGGSENLNSTKKSSTQSSIKINIKTTDIEVLKTNDFNHLLGQFQGQNKYNLQYAMGLGLFKPGRNAPGCLRDSLNSGGHFTVTITILPTLYANDSDKQNKAIAELSQAMQLIGLLGGLGSNSNNGFGSIAIQSLSAPDVTAWEAPSNKDDYIKLLNNITFEPVLGDSIDCFSPEPNNNGDLQSLAYAVALKKVFLGWNYAYVNGEFVLKKNEEYPNKHKDQEIIRAIINDSTIVKILEDRNIRKKILDTSNTSLLNDKGFIESIKKIVGDDFFSQIEISYKDVFDLKKRKVSINHEIKEKRLPSKFVFGLPKTYADKTRNDNGISKEVTFELDDKDRSRRESLVALHIHQFSNNEFLPVYILSNALLFNRNDDIKIKVRFVIKENNKERTVDLCSSVSTSNYSNSLLGEFKNYLSNKQWNSLEHSDE